MFGQVSRDFLIAQIIFVVLLAGGCAPRRPAEVAPEYKKPLREATEVKVPSSYPPIYLAIIWTDTPEHVLPSQTTGPFNVWEDAYSPLPRQTLVDAIKNNRKVALTVAVSAGAEFPDGSSLQAWDKETLDVLAEFAHQGRVELAIAPCYPVLLPVIADSNGIEQASWQITPPLNYTDDVRNVLARSIGFCISRTGVAPKGLVPPAGAVSNKVLDIVSPLGISWSVCGENTLVASTDKLILRDAANNVTNPDVLYHPYVIARDEAAAGFNQIPVAAGFSLRKQSHTGQTISNIPAQQAQYLVFRDNHLTKILQDAISGSLVRSHAVSEFIASLQAIRKRLGADASPHLVTVTISPPSPEQANQLAEVCQLLFMTLANTSGIETTTVSKFISETGNSGTLSSAQSAPQLELVPSSWMDDNFSSWLGEAEENTAWSLAARARTSLARYQNSGRAKISKLNQAIEIAYLLETNWWYWWYGSDHETPGEAMMDNYFRKLVSDLYKTIEREPPSQTFSSIVKKNEVQPEYQPRTQFTPVLDGVPEQDEWLDAGYLPCEESGKVLRGIWWGWNGRNMHFRIDFEKLEPPFDIAMYFALPDILPANHNFRFPSQGRTLSGPGAGLTNELLIHVSSDTLISGPIGVISLAGGDEKWEKIGEVSRVGISSGTSGTMECSIPIRNLAFRNKLRAGMVGTVNKENKLISKIPEDGIAVVTLPEEPQSQLVSRVSHGATTILKCYDEMGDDDVQGDYYPGTFDIRQFEVSVAGNDLLFTVQLSTLGNTGYAPNGFSVQTFDIYIDQNALTGEGCQELLGGRHAFTTPRDAWEYAITVDGWESSVYRYIPGQELQKIGSAPVISDIQTGEIGIALPLEPFKGNPANWGYTCVIAPYKTLKSTIPVVATGEKKSPIADIVLPQGANQSQILSAWQKGLPVEIPALRVETR
jgi:hypothetical protein